MNDRTAAADLAATCRLATFLENMALETSEDCDTSMMALVDLAIIVRRQLRGHVANYANGIAIDIKAARVAQSTVNGVIGWCC